MPLTVGQPELITGCGRVGCRHIDCWVRISRAAVFNRLDSMDPSQPRDSSVAVSYKLDGKRTAQFDTPDRVGKVSAGRIGPANWRQESVKAQGVDVRRTRTRTVEGVIAPIGPGLAQTRRAHRLTRAGILVIERSRVARDYAVYRFAGDDPAERASVDRRRRIAVIRLVFAATVAVSVIAVMLAVVVATVPST